MKLITHQSYELLAKHGRYSKAGVLTKRQKYDYRDIDRGELKLIRVGHALWVQYKREKRQNGGYLSEEQPIYAALQTIWRLKREYRAGLRLKLAAQSQKIREKFMVMELVN
jgi:hypothetical protein